MGKKIRFGIFGLWRGEAFVHIVNTFKDEAVLAAVCDKDQSKRDNVKSICEKEGAENVLVYDNFDEFIASGIDVAVLCNNFHQHTPYAVAALKRGIHVISECTSAATLKECVQLCRAVEASGCRYMIAENYPFTPERLEMARLAQSGMLGQIQYAEGEYNHPCPVADLEYLTPGKYHWRAWLPRTYYVTHALGPIMYMAQTMPLTVNARAVHSPEIKKIEHLRHNYDSVGMMLCQMDNGAIFRFTGCTEMMSPSGYRIVGERGSAECGRAVPAGSVFSTYKSWDLPEGCKPVQTYEPALDEVMQRASGYGHGGGDYYIIYNMIESLLYGKSYFFDVYCGASMSAVGILGWRSIINDGATYHIPDFRNEEERKKVEDDDLTPFPDENGDGITLPCSSMDARDKGYKIYF